MPRAIRLSVHSTPSRIACVLLAGALACDPAAAQTARNSGGSSTQQAIRQVQQLAQERTALQTENEQLKAQLADLRKKLSDAESKNASLQGRANGGAAEIAKARASVVELEADVARRKEREAQLVAEFRKTIDTLRAVEADRTTLQQRGSSLAREHERCVQNNVELAGIAKDALERYENAGFRHAVGRAEPFTRLARTRVENIVDEQRARVEELRSAPSTDPGAVVPPAKQ